MQGKFTVIFFAVDVGSGETLTMSRHVDNDDKKFILDYCKVEAGVDEEVDTILVLRNGEDGPEVFHHWTAIGGDFQGL